MQFAFAENVHGSKPISCPCTRAVLEAEMVAILDFSKTYNFSKTRGNLTKFRPLWQLSASFWRIFYDGFSKDDKSLAISLKNDLTLC